MMCWVTLCHNSTHNNYAFFCLFSLKTTNPQCGFGRKLFSYKFILLWIVELWLKTLNQKPIKSGIMYVLQGLVPLVRRRNTILSGHLNSFHAVCSNTREHSVSLQAKWRSQGYHQRLQTIAENVTRETLLKGRIIFWKEEYLNISMFTASACFPLFKQ